MIYKIKTMGGAEIPAAGEELAGFLQQVNDGKKLIVLQHGIVNVSSIDSVEPFKEKMKYVSQYLDMGRNQEEAEKEVLGVSPFAKLLSGKMAMLSDKSRTETQEEFAREERKLKT